MKKILFSIGLLLGLGLAVQAQHPDCAKACAGKGDKASCQVKIAESQTPIPADYQTAAAKMASLDATIEPRTNPVTGEVTYVRKETSSQNGEVSFVALNFDPATSSFVNVSPSQVAAESHPGVTCDHGKKCSGKSCCAAGASSKSCCADKTKSGSSTAAASTAPAPVKVTKTTGGSND